MAAADASVEARKNALKKCAVAATAAATGSEDFAALAQRIGELREPRRGRPQAWMRELMHWSDRDLAAAIRYHVLRTRLEAQEDDMPPYASTIGSALGADLVSAKERHLMIGCQLLGVAESTGLIEFVEDASGGVRVRLANRTFRSLQRVAGAAAPHVRHRVSKQPPSGVETRKKHSMLLARPDVPLRVAEAADKVQGTAWRINRAVLEQIGDNAFQGAYHDADNDEKLLHARTVAEASVLQELEQFYFPVFLDFRGRLYQRSGALSYTGGGDYARGLLEFASGEFVDDTGSKWLAWHMAQMWGRELPYMPLGDGSAWLPDAPDKRRWRDAKHPAQFLAAALAVEDALEGRPVHLPVRVDASCSGLQHLALLVRDAELARTVNLWGDYHGDRQGKAWLEIPRQDFYDLVAEERNCDRKAVKAVLVPLLYGAGKGTSARQLADVLGARQTKRVRVLANAIRTTARTHAPRAFALLDWFGKVAKCERWSRTA